MLPRGSAIGFISSAAGLGWEANLDRAAGVPRHPRLRRRRRSGRRSNGKADYMWSKQAINAYVAREAFALLKQGIRINAICPGPTDTPLAQANEEMWLGFGADYRAEVGIEASTPLEQAYPLVFLCSDGGPAHHRHHDGHRRRLLQRRASPSRSRRRPRRSTSWPTRPSSSPVRPLPQLTPVNEWFWTSGADGHLRIQGCDDCEALVHPPAPVCPACRSRSSGADGGVGPGHRRRRSRSTTTSGCPAFEPPYVDRQRRARRGPDACASPPTSSAASPTRSTSARRSTVRFEQHDDVWLPLFEPTGGDRPGRPGPASRERPRAPARRSAPTGSSTGSVLVRRRPLGDRPAADGRPAVADRRRLPRRGRRRRAHASTTSTGCRPTRASARHGHERGRRDRGRGGAAAPADVDQRRRRPARARRRGDRGDAGRGERPVPPRPVLPHGLGVDLRRARARRGRRPAAAGSSGPMQEWRAPFGAHVGRELDRHERQPVPPPLRRDPRDARAGSRSTAAPTRRATRPPSTATR